MAYLHCDQIAEPLVCQLVRNDLGDAVAVLEAGDAPDVEQVRLAIRHQTPVFHGPGVEVRHGHHVLLGQRARQPEVVLVKVQHDGPDLRGVPRLFVEGIPGPDPELHLVVGVRRPVGGGSNGFYTGKYPGDCQFVRVPIGRLINF